jgi:predicted RNase H-like nuclease (RuvC/YqgF family)
MGNEDGTDDRALADCNETVDELKQQNAELQEENQDLREASTTFGDLAERLSDELRKENENVKTGTTIEAEPEGDH